MAQGKGIEAGRPPAGLRITPARLTIAVLAVTALFFVPALLTDPSAPIPSPRTPVGAQPATIAREPTDTAAEEPPPGRHHVEPIKALEVAPQAPSAREATTVRLELNYWLEAEKAEAELRAWLERPATPAGWRGLRTFTGRLMPTEDGALQAALSFPSPGQWALTVYVKHPRFDGYRLERRTLQVGDPRPDAGWQAMTPRPRPTLYLLSYERSLTTIDALTGEAGETTILLDGDAGWGARPPFLIAGRGDRLALRLCADSECQQATLVLVSGPTGEVISQVGLRSGSELLGSSPDGRRIFLLEPAESATLGGTLRLYLADEVRFHDVAIEKRQLCRIGDFMPLDGTRAALFSCLSPGTSQKPEGHVAFFRADFADGSLSRIAELPVMREWGVKTLLHPQGDRLFLVDLEAQQVTVVDAGTGEILRSGRYGQTATLFDRILDWLWPSAQAKMAIEARQGAALSPDGSRLYVLESVFHEEPGAAGGVLVLDTETLAPVGELGPEVPFTALFLDPDASRLYASEGAVRIHVFDAEGLEALAVHEVPGVDSVAFLAYGAPADWTWLPRTPVYFNFEGQILAIDLNRAEARDVGGTPSVVHETLQLPDRDEPLFASGPRQVTDTVHAIPLFRAGERQPIALLEFPTEAEPCQGCLRYDLVPSLDGRLYLALAVRYQEDWQLSFHTYDATRFERLWSVPIGSASTREVWLRGEVHPGSRLASVQYTLADEAFATREQRLVGVDLSSRRAAPAVEVYERGGCYTERWLAAEAGVVQLGCQSHSSSTSKVRLLEPLSGAVREWELPLVLRSDFLPPAVAVHGSRLFVASAEEPVLAALDLSSGELQVAELRPGVSFLRRLLAFLAPAAEAKMMIEPQLLLSHDGRTLYLSRWDTGAAEREDRLGWLPEGYRGRGVWVIDASTLEVRDRWLPEDEVWVMRLSQDGRYLYTFDFGGRWLRVLDAATGRVLRTVDGLPGGYWAELLFAP